MIRGKFGPITIRDTARSRLLLINNQVQGGSLFDPGADILDPDLTGEPGPLSESMYTLGWLVAGAMNPIGNILQVGLGSGAGIVQLLYCFPHTEVTVVEIDPEVIKTASASYPLIPYYIEHGRLHLVCADAETYLKELDGGFDVGCADGYTGSTNRLVTTYFDPMWDRCDELYINAIDTADGPVVTELIDYARAQDRPFKAIFKASTKELAPTWESFSNWILTTQEPNWTTLLDPDLFNDLPGTETVMSRWPDFLKNHATVPLD